MRVWGKREDGSEEEEGRGEEQRRKETEKLEKVRRGEHEVGEIEEKP